MRATLKEVAELAKVSVATASMALNRGEVKESTRTRVLECGQSPQVHAAHAVTLVDTHGAGDTFIGALVARLVDGSSLLEATRFANAAASLFVSTPADQKKSVTFDRVAQFLSEPKGGASPLP